MQNDNQNYSNVNNTVPNQVQPDPNLQPGNLSQPPTTQPNLNYDFILNQNHSKKLFSNFNSSKSRMLIITLGVLLLIIIFVVVKSLLSNPIFSTSDFLAVVRDQQNILHVLNTDTTTNQEVASLSLSNKNFVASTNLVFSSDQQNNLSYLKNNGFIFSPATIALGVNTSLDNQINSSLNANTYNQTLDQIMTTLIANYINDLKVTYKSERGSKGKALLETEYQNAYLLYKSLGNS